MNSLLIRPPGIQQKLKQGLVAFWPLASSGAVDLKSIGPQPYDLTNGNVVARAAGPSATLPDAASFVSASLQRLSRATTNALTRSRRSFTITGWFYCTTIPASGTILGIYEATSGRQFVIDVASGTGNTRILLSTNGTSNPQFAVSPGIVVSTWYFLTLRYFQSSGRCEISLNLGTPGVATQTGLFDSSADLTFGAIAGGTNYFNGRLSNFGMWDRILLETELRWLYNNGQGNSLSPPKV